ncbi:MAG: hypothetical protein FRX49_02221 [Trebouxia sp. A1-2]|nr:MAG: hypothetical protein FRX49_02221 [Trebouxia sp. A1-2]
MAGPADTTQAVQGVTPNVITLLQRVLPQPKPTVSAHHSPQVASDSLNRLHEDGQRWQLDAREQAGSVLWDTTQSEGPATIAVANSGLDIIPLVVLHAISHQQFRLAELLLGALANILCHSRLAELAAQQQPLHQSVLDISHSTTDAPCLAESFRLMTVAVKGPAGSAWLDTLLHGPFDLLWHLIWIAENTLNATLFERCLDLLLAVAYKREETLQHMLEAGIMPVIINALKACTCGLQQGAALQPAALEAVFEVLKDDYGFEEGVEADAALQGREAAWAVLVAVSKHLAGGNAVPQVFSCLADCREVLTDSSLADVAPGSASYVWRTLLQALDSNLTVRDDGWRQAEASQQSKLSALKVQLTEALRHLKQLM